MSSAPATYLSGPFQKDVWSLTNDALLEVSRDEKRKFSDVYHMGMGYFNYSPPEFIIEEAQKGLMVPENNQYSPQGGEPILVDSLIKLYSPVFETQLTNENILVTTGAIQALLESLMALIKPGDEVIVIEPFFDPYIHLIKIAGGVVKYVPLTNPNQGKKRILEANDWILDRETLRAAFTDKTKLMIINNPNNPLGKVFNRDELLEMATLCVNNGAYIIADEVYEFLQFTPNPLSRISNLSEAIAQKTITIGSAGKIFRVTGWRVGWMISKNRELVEKVTAVHVRMGFCSPSISQVASGLGIQRALECGYFLSMPNEFDRKFSIIYKALDYLGVSYTKPQGAHFIITDFSKVKIPEDYQFPEYLKNRARDFFISYWLTQEFCILLLPCSEFYCEEHRKNSETYLRITVSKDEDYLEKVASRLTLLKECMTY
ncbi:pyridoxal phosphate-dependent aminotransferase Ecym_6292 [Eremothecium cymbalariae DBVPG|uniref:Aminotransferase class I/classII large domain-containing protein n=1 Tax=Eremothecium cymbalariae (strain CBS 270.75 / DBVPG 7215 / KCTC 17166 / NRRL Y-17582) TaxID=931890 RepID=G8JVJ3_ERECY|nr:hypothetical protein Ecym_6292 [Eremothecium cymbalariae DBVPG\